jgi:hypothetical protein
VQQLESIIFHTVLIRDVEGNLSMFFDPIKEKQSLSVLPQVLLEVLLVCLPNDCITAPSLDLVAGLRSVL